MTVMPMPASEATRERVLRVADTMFAAHGYAAVSMREVAGAAGVTKPAIYYHFKDKESLYEECILAAQRRLSDLLVTVAAGPGPTEQRVRAAARVLLTASPHHPVRTQSDVAEHLPPEARRRVARSWVDLVVRPLTDLFGEVAAASRLRPGVTPGEAAAVLLALSMAFLPVAPGSGDAGAGEAAHPRAGAVSNPTRSAAVVADLVLHGVVAPG